MCSKSAKKPAAVAFARDGTHAFVADKFGDVAAAATAGGDAAPLLGHYSRCMPALASAPPQAHRLLCLEAGDRILHRQQGASFTTAPLGRAWRAAAGSGGGP